MGFRNTLICNGSCHSFLCWILMVFHRLLSFIDVYEYWLLSNEKNIVFLILSGGLRICLGGFIQRLGFFMDIFVEISNVVGVGGFELPTVCKCGLLVSWCWRDWFFGSCHGYSFVVVVLLVACPVMRFVAAAVAVSRCGSVLSVIADVVIQLAWQISHYEVHLFQTGFIVPFSSEWMTQSSM